jgi:predicted enzyme related to lactoylglutathione lyase
MRMEALRKHPGKGAPAPLQHRSRFSLDFTFHSAKERAAMSDTVSNSVNHHQINYIEFVSNNIERSKQFYATVFGWSFADWGPEYISFQAASAGIDGGFRKGEAQTGSPLVVLYTRDLAATEQAITAAGGSITVPTFEFPGGHRFHFNDGAGNELAVWSE